MITGVAFCPQPPLLVPEVASGAAAELDALRDACRAAISAVAAGRQLVLLGAGPRSQAHSPLARGTLAGFGVPGEIHLGAPTCGGDLELPPALTVGAWLVRDALGPRSGARGFSVGPDFAASPAAVELLTLAETTDVALLVLGDGSARRSTTAPGYLDERAAGFDASVADALRSGEGRRLEKLDGELAGELLAAGVPAWHATAAVLPEQIYSARLSYDQAPYGVGYFVATWTLPGARPAPAAAPSR
ncbi:MAG TPA: hypothetical protein VFE40_12450 [Jatrophihabitantaceae bacterium]|nr:hypothetical protein [Jatrophihabitantaceae bacterium]